MDSDPICSYSVSSVDTYQYLKKLMGYPQKDSPQNLLDIDTIEQKGQDPIKAGQLVYSKTNFEFEQAALFAGCGLKDDALYDIQAYDEDEQLLKMRIRFVDLNMIKEISLPEQGSVFIECDGKLIATLNLLKEKFKREKYGNKSQIFIQRDIITISLPQSYFQGNEHQFKFTLKFGKDSEILLGSVQMPCKQVLSRKNLDRFKRMFPLFNEQDADSSQQGDTGDYMSRDLNELLQKDKLTLEFKTIEPYSAINHVHNRASQSEISKGTQDYGYPIEDEIVDEDDDGDGDGDHNIDQQSKNENAVDNQEVLEIKFNEATQKTYIRRKQTIQVIQSTWKDLDQKKEVLKPKTLETIQIDNITCEGDCIQFGKDNSGYCVMEKSTIAKVGVSDRKQQYQTIKMQDNEIQEDQQIKLFTVLKQANALVLYMLINNSKSSVFLLNNIEFPTDIIEIKLKNHDYPENCSYLCNVFHEQSNDDCFDLIFGTELGEIIVSRKVINKPDNKESLLFSENKQKNKMDQVQIHYSKVTCIKQLNRDQLVASGAKQDNFVSIWDLQNLKQISRINCPGHILDLKIIENTQDIAILSSSGLFRVNKVFPNDYEMNELIQSKQKLVICSLGDEQHRFLAAYGNKLIQITCGSGQNNSSKIEQKIPGIIQQIKAYQDEKKQIRVFLLIRESKKSQQIEADKKELRPNQQSYEPTEDTISDSEQEDLNSHEIYAEDGQININMFQENLEDQLNRHKSLKLPKQKQFLQPQKYSLNREQNNGEIELVEGGDPEQTARALIQKRHSAPHIQANKLNDDYKKFVQELILYSTGDQLEKGKIGYLDNNRYQDDDNKINEMYIIGDKKKYLFTRAIKDQKIMLYRIVKTEQLMTEQQIINNNNPTIQKGEDLLAKNSVNPQQQNDFFKGTIVGVDYIPKLKRGVIIIQFKNKGIKILSEGISNGNLLTSIGFMESSSVNEIIIKKETQILAMNISQNKDFTQQLMVTGDHKGLIHVWLINQDLLKYKQPHKIIDYQNYGQVVSIKLIQQKYDQSEIGVLVSLHKCKQLHDSSNNNSDTPDHERTPGLDIDKEHYHLVITSLRDFQQTRMIEIRHECVDFDYFINNQMCLSILVILKQYVSFKGIVSENPKHRHYRVNTIKYDLSFKYNHTDIQQLHNLTLRDQNLLTLFSLKQQDQHINKNLLSLMQQDGNRGVIDCLNSVNLINFFVQQRIEGFDFKQLFKYGKVDNLVDSNSNYVSNYLTKSKNLDQLEELFDQFKDNYIPFDRYVIEYGLNYKSSWVNDINIDPFFAPPQFWQTKALIKGKIKFTKMQRLRQQEIYFGKRELKLVSDSFIDEIIQRTNEDNESKNNEDQNDDDVQVIEILQSIEPYQFFDGSDDIINFLDLAGKYPIEVYEKTKIGLFIDYIWKKNTIDVPFIQYTVYVSLLLSAAFTYERESVVWKYLIVIINIIYIINEFFQMFSVKDEYLEDPQNYIEWIGFIFVFLYTKSIFSTDAVIDEDSERQYLSILVLMNLTTYILYCASVFKKTRITWIIISNSLWEVKTYLFIPLLFILTFSISRHITADDEGWSNIVIFRQEIFGQYQQVFGENLEDMPNEKYSVILIYFVGTILINIVCLNIIISVVTDNYDLVMQRLDAEDSNYKAQNMETYHRIMRLKNLVLKKFNIGYTPKEYLFIIQYKEHKAKKNSSQSGKFKSLMVKVDATNKKLTELQESFNEFKKQMEVQNQNNNQSVDDLKKQLSNQILLLLQKNVTQKQDERFLKVETMLQNINETIETKLTQRKNYF